MESLLNFIAQYDRKFPSLIEGAQLGEILTLERLVGTPLPVSYKNYLARMGRNDGGLNIGQGATTKIHEIVAYYKEIIDLGEHAIALPLNCIVIAVAGVASFELSLEILGDREPCILATSGNEIKGVVAASLDKLLFRTAFIKYRARQCPQSGIYSRSWSAELWEDAFKIALRLGFVPEWFSDDVTFCGQRNDAIIIIDQFMGRQLWARIAGETKAVIELIADEFVVGIGMTFKQWWP